LRNDEGASQFAQRGKNAEVFLIKGAAMACPLHFCQMIDI
jgi:hypothetical protein